MLFLCLFTEHKLVISTCVIHVNTNPILTLWFIHTDLTHVYKSIMKIRTWQTRKFQFRVKVLKAECTFTLCTTMLPYFIESQFNHISLKWFYLLFIATRVTAFRSSNRHKTMAASKNKSIETLVIRKIIVLTKPLCFNTLLRTTFFLFWYTLIGFIWYWCEVLD